jgi:hypothetical protein
LLSSLFSHSLHFKSQEWGRTSAQPRKSAAHDKRIYMKACIANRRLTSCVAFARDRDPSHGTRLK